MPSIRVRRVPGAPVVAIRVWLPGGSTAEDLPGQALVSGRLLLEGTGRRSWRRISEEAESRGMAMDADAGYEAQGLSIDALADDWRLALDWAAELVLDSVFAEDRCRWLARRATAELEQMADHPDVRTSWAFDRQLFGAAARGRPLQGSVESLGRLEAPGCRGFHSKCLERGAILAVAGEISESDVERRLRELFGHLPAPNLTPPPPAPSASEVPARQVVELDDGEQAHWFGGAITTSRRHPDVWALGLLGVILGAGGNLSGRITHRVRELEGLTYGCAISTVAGAGAGAGCFSVAIGCSQDRLPVVEEAVTGELDRLVRDGVTEEELRDAKAFVLGRAPFARETARQWANLLAQAELFGVAIDDSEWTAARWRQVGREDASRVARRYLDPRRLRITVGSAQGGPGT